MRRRPKGKLITLCRPEVDETTDELVDDHARVIDTSYVTEKLDELSRLVDHFAEPLSEEPCQNIRECREFVAMLINDPFHDKRIYHVSEELQTFSLLASTSYRASQMKLYRSCNLKSIVVRRVLFFTLPQIAAISVICLPVVITSLMTPPMMVLQGVVVIMLLLMACFNLFIVNADKLEALSLRSQLNKSIKLAGDGVEKFHRVAKDLERYMTLGGSSHVLAPILSIKTKVKEIPFVIYCHILSSACMKTLPDSAAICQIPVTVLRSIYERSGGSKIKVSALRFFSIRKKGLKSMLIVIPGVLQLKFVSGSPKFEPFLCLTRNL